jgi:flagellar motor protein MotB|tara:strand:- start:23164 stop:23307 length:144 start_codon:yes stop_codon:yes gene_type:complete
MPVDESLMTLNIAMDSTVVMGFSSTRPISNNETSKGQKQNRREAFIF